MFMQKKTTPESATRRPAARAKGREEAKKSNRAQMNLFGVADENGSDGDELDDSALEAELLDLLHGGGSPRKGGRKPPPVPKSVMAPIEIPDFKSDDEGDDDDIDEADLEAELNILTKPDTPPPFFSTETIEPVKSSTSSVSAPGSSGMVQTLEERLKMYEKAVETEAKGSAKERRFTRAIKSLKDLIKKAKAGGVINEEDIPPVVATKPKPENDPVSQPQSFPSPIEMKEEVVMPIKPLQPDPPIFEPLTDGPKPSPAPEPVSVVVPPEVAQRIKEYKKYAVALKRSGDVPNSIRYLKLAKTLETAASSGDDVDLSAFPALSDSVETGPAISKDNNVNPVEPTPSIPDPVPIPEASDPGPTEESRPPSTKNILEALQERLEKYQSEVQKAQEADNSSKARRMGRIVKQYQEAIQLYKRGKPVPYEELPNPPGFDPLPVPGLQNAEGTPSTSASTPAPEVSVKEPIRTPAPVPVTPSDDGTPKRTSIPRGPEGISPQSGAGRGKKASASLTLQERQFRLLQLRKQQFTNAAINAKKRGDVEQAREYLRTSKGIEKLLQANQCGLPVDMNTVPSEPEVVGALEAENFEVVSADDCLEPSSNEFELFSKFEEDLKNQMKMCMQTRNHYKAMGDIAAANRFEKFAIECKQDLDVLRLSAKQGGALPKFQYVQKVFSITECNTDLTEDEIEISILQGINYKVPNPTTVDTYVKADLAYPSAEEVQTNKTTVVKDTNNPVYNATFKMTIDRKARNFQRFVHRHGVKLEVWSKGYGLNCRTGCCYLMSLMGFLRSSTLIGTATAKLAGLESKCTLHDAFEILDGRKPVGKLEVKIRLRDPIIGKQITQRNERWLSLAKA